MTNLIKSFILTSKSIRCIVENNQYVLNVDQKLKKPEIKKLCQEIFNTQVISVNTYNLPPKKRHTKMKRVFVKFAGPKGNNPLDNFVKSTGLKEKKFPLETLK
uniref:ribosomal protein L23 n=1 Tax=Trentepohlia sp. BN17 TaxID=3063876 RepID=UPI001EDF7092|nr:ribosomal protein L23 [Trentepohlia sp. BN17]UIB38758.1 ribosomal protein L23 [Trentepohlia sp. BN17]